MPLTNKNSTYRPELTATRWHATSRACAQEAGSLSRCWVAFILLALALLVAPPSMAAVDLLENGVLLHDPAGHWDAVGALRAARAQSSPSVQPQIDGHIYWLMADVVNDGAEPNWVVSFSTVWFERYDIFVFEGERLLQSVQGGKRVAPQLPPSLAIDFSVPFDLPPGATRTVLIRIETPVFMRILADAMPAEEHNVIATTRGGIALLTFGALMALMLYNLLIAAGLRDGNYVLYSLHALGYFFFFFENFGYLPRLFHLVTPAPFSMFVMWWTQLFGALFCFRFLNVPQFARGLQRLYWGYFLLVVGQLPGYFLMDFYAWMQMVRSSHLLLVPLVLYTSVAGIVRGVRQAWYVMGGWGVLLLGTAMGVLAMLGTIRYTPNTSLMVFVADLFEMFVLSLALADRVRQLQQEKVLAERTNAAKSEFLANISHEVRTPLYGLLGTVRLLLATPLSTSQRQYASTIRNAAEVLLGLLNNILDFSKAEAEMISADVIDFRVADILADLQQLIAAQAAEKGLRLRVELDPQMPEYLRGDPSRLRQVLLNLLGNAVKFTEKGGVELSVERLGAEGTWHRVRFSVIDSGIGISQELQNQLFDRFVQGDASISRRYGGTGLGLAITKRLVEIMGGEIGLESREGQGSHFFLDISLPPGAAPSQPASQASETAPATPPQPSLRVLVVDDVELNRLIGAELLRQQGHRTWMAASGQEALQMLAGIHFDVVLMDIQMPEMDGVEATRRLRAAGDLTPVIGLTAGSTLEHRETYAAAGFDAMLDKGGDLDELCQTVASVAQRRGCCPA